MVTDLDSDPDLNPGDRALCDACRLSHAVLAAHYPGIRARPPRWCASCSGPLLADLVDAGHVVTVTTATGGQVEPGPAEKGHRQVNGVAPIELDGEIGIADLPWTIDYATELLRYAKPGGLQFLRALVDEGGSASAARLKEVIGVDALNPLTATLNAAVRTFVGRRRLRYEDRHLAKPRPPADDPRRKVVDRYELPPDLVPILNEALTVLGWPPAART